MRPLRPVLIPVAFVLAAAAWWALGPTARAGDAIVVTTTEDEINADGDCSLREAVMAINTQAPVDGCPGAPGSRNIFLEPGEYRLTIPGAGEDAGLTGDLDVLRPLSVDPTGAGRVSIDGGGLDRIFDIHPSAHPLRTVFVGIALHNGDAGAEDGGAMRISDRLCDGSPGGHRDVELFGVIIDESRAARGGGVHIGTCNMVTVIGSSIVRNEASQVGGGVSMEGSSVVGLDTATVSSNQATTAGGGIWADLSEESFGWSAIFSTIAENAAADGGGIWTRTGANASTSIIASNEPANCGGPGSSAAGALADDDTCGGPGHDDAGLLALTSTGPFPVHPLDEGSPAIDAAGVPPGDWCAEYGPYDQVGAPRPLDGDGDGIAACDAGAIEAPALPVIAPPATPSTAPLPDTAADAGESVSPQPGWWLPCLLAAAVLSAGLGWRLGPRRARSR